MKGKLFLLFVVSIFSFFAVTNCDSSVLPNVLDHGAVGDGETDDTDAFVSAWKATCESSFSAPVMQVPAGYDFLINPVSFTGPCNGGSITVEINGNIVAPKEPSDWQCEDECDKWIHFKRVDGLFLHGNGTIDGRGEKWWQHPHKYRGPTAFEISGSNNVRINGLRFKDNPRMHLVLNGLRTAFVSHITIDAPEDSPNTDGIHVSGCTDVVIDHCTIKTGDDCISIVDGSSHLKVSNIICGPGHGISIGSLGKDGATGTVEYVQVSDIVFVKSTNGARIKTWQGGSGYARHMVFERILSHQAQNPIIINQFYCDHEQCVTQDSAVRVQNITFRQVLGTSMKKTSVTLACSETFPCQDIVLEDIYILSKDQETTMSDCSSAYGKASGITVPDLSCLNQT